MTALLKVLLSVLALLPPGEGVTVEVVGHVKKEGKYEVHRRPASQPLDEVIALAGGFDPLDEFKNETTTDVVWLERGEQHIIIDYKNRQILSQRPDADEKWKFERYDWETFEFQPGDFVFVTTSRKSLDLAFIPVRYVEDNGWKNFQSLRYYGKNLMETQEIDAAKGR